MKEEEKKEIAVVQDQLDKAHVAVTAINITDNDSLQNAVGIRAKIYGLAKIIETKKKSITDPINSALKEVRAMFKPVEDHYESLRLLVDGKIMLYEKEKAEAARKAQEKIEARVEKGTLKQETAIKKIAKIETVEKNIVSESGGGVQFREIKKINIFDPSLVPDQYWILDEVRIRKEALAGVQIAGVKIEVEKVLANR